jgi:hypothetical protein
MAQISWTENRGRDGWSGSPLQIRTDMSAEAVNVTLYNGGLGTKRGGSTIMAESGLSEHNAMFEYVPGQDLTAAELFTVDNSATKKILRCVAGSSTTKTDVSLTLADAITSEAYNAVAVALNKKLYIAYKSGVNRLHVFDPSTSTTAVRRAGLAPFAAAATVANTGGGAYPATLRYYKTRSTEQQSSVTTRRAEANASVSFTPSGAGTAARITRPTAVGESETHWEVYGSTDNVTFYGPIATIAIATTTYDDSSTPSSWATTYDAEPVAGQQTPFPSVRSLATDGTRLIGFGAYETTAVDYALPGKNGRVYIGPAIDSSDTHDDERISNTTEIQGWMDVARNSGYVDRGITPKPVNDRFYVFQSSGVYALIPTQSPAAPYRRVVLDSQVGAVNQQSIVLGHDRTGGACAYFLDPTLGPFTVGGSDGLKWCGKDVKDKWDLFNRDSTGTVPAFGLWHPDRNMVLFWIATAAGNPPDTILVLDVTEQYVDKDGDLRGGWTVWTGGLFPAARCGVMFSNTLAATRSRNRVPYVGLDSGTTLLRYDESVTSDNGTAFQASVTSGALAAEPYGIEVQRSYLRAGASNGVSIQQSLIRNTGDETARTDTVLLNPTGSQTNVLKKFEAAALQDGDTFQVQLGDASAVASAWSLLAWDATIKIGAPL